MQYLIVAHTGESVKVDADNWLIAMGKALVFFDAGLDHMTQWTVRPDDAGVFIEDRTLGASWSVQPIRATLRIVVAAASPRGADEPAPAPVADAEETAPPAPPPALLMPAATTLAPPPPREVAPEPPAAPEEVFSDDDLAERLFSLSMDMAGVGADEACRIALGIITEVVPCEAASVVRAGRYDDQLTFAAATGPVADRLVGRQLRFGQGLVGLCHESGMTLIVADARADSRHYRRVDADTGFETRAILTVPVRSEGGPFGAVQLLNPASPFTPRDVEIVETIARSLAEALAETS